MMNNTLSNTANDNAYHGIITPSATIITEISIVNANIPSIVSTGSNRCRTVVTTITITVVVTITTIAMIAIHTIIIIITSTRQLLVLLLTFF